MNGSKDLLTWLVICCAKLNSGSGNSATGGQNIRRKLASAEIQRNVQTKMLFGSKSKDQFARNKDTGFVANPNDI